MLYLLRILLFVIMVGTLGLGFVFLFSTLQAVVTSSFASLTANQVLQAIAGPVLLIGGLIIIVRFVHLLVPGPSRSSSPLR